jgi:hypothetical protein
VDIAARQAHGSITWQTPQQMPQEHPKKTIEISGSLYQRMEDAKPEYLSTTGFFQLMADKGLTGCATLGISETLAGSLSFSELKKIRSEEINHPQAAKEITSTDSERKSKNQYGKRLDPEVIPAELQDCSDQIIEFWAVKKGTRSEGAATRLFNKLRVMGPSARIAALHAATDAGWSTVYEPKTDTPTQGRHNHQAEPEFKHPAHQVFTAADFN